jgi:hypothetical protein
LLLLLPFLVGSGLLSYKSHYQELSRGYYFLDFIILLLSFMYLGRIKNAEQLKKISPGEFGKLMGISGQQMSAMNFIILTGIYRYIADIKPIRGRNIYQGKSYACRACRSFG